MGKKIKSFFRVKDLIPEIKSNLYKEAKEHTKGNYVGSYTKTEII